ncbi:dipeptide/oligopeptide/nickel ABC transporter permease [Candidatus Magnetoovum chiemensis]|nr:dipeptide/oligopeptide/nickel ABC transporter permease [Candidatus Magnetoovum chiemensis]
MPVFWSGLILIIIFSLNLRLLPPSGTGGLSYMILPSLTLALPAISGIARITRSSVSEILDKPFMTVLKAKGLRKTRIIYVHILKNILIPLVTVIGLDFGSYLNGAVLTETIFGWDGLGRYALDGIIKRDYPVILGCLLIGTAAFVIVNTVVDILYQYLDPRLRIFSSKKSDV